MGKWMMYGKRGFALWLIGILISMAVLAITTVFGVSMLGLESLTAMSAVLMGALLFTIVLTVVLWFVHGYVATWVVKTIK